MDADIPSVTIPVHCGRCGRRVTVEYIPEALADVALYPRSWRCPHSGCTGLNAMGGVRSVVAVWTDHGPKPG